MNERLIKTVTSWARYVAAVATWAGDCFISFPRKDKFFKEADGVRPTNPTNTQGSGV
jgi:hypothetical protein